MKTRILNFHGWGVGPNTPNMMKYLEISHGFSTAVFELGILWQLSRQAEIHTVNWMTIFQVISFYFIASKLNLSDLLDFEI